MRWIRFSLQGRTAYGILDGDRVNEVRGDPFAGFEKTTRVHDLDAVKIEVITGWIRCTPVLTGVRFMLPTILRHKYSKAQMWWEFYWVMAGTIISQQLSGTFTKLPGGAVLHFAWICASPTRMVHLKPSSPTINGKLH